MRLHRFFVTEPLEGKDSFVATDRDLLHQWKNVFRFQVGHRLILLDNSSYEFIVQIVLLTGIKAEVQVISSKISGTNPQVDLTLFAALIKKDNFEWILEKGTEVGVSHFVPVLAEKSEKKNFNLERAGKIIQEATEQSGRARLPNIYAIHETADALNFCKEQKIESIVVLDPTGTEKLDKKIIGNNKKVAIFIGPEGGWSTKELELFKEFKEKGTIIATFGEAILRAETAAIVGAATFLL